MQMFKYIFTKKLAKIRVSKYILAKDFRGHHRQLVSIRPIHIDMTHEQRLAEICLDGFIAVLLSLKYEKLDFPNKTTKFWE